MKAVVLLSGGMDSSTLLYHVRSFAEEVRVLSINYGQRHIRELEAASVVREAAGIPAEHHKIVSLEFLREMLGTSCLTSDAIAVPEGHYADISMKSTVVPNRNMFMLAIAAAWAISSRHNVVAYACHTGDHDVYPDCRPAFVDAMVGALRLCDYEPGVDLYTPFLLMDKAAIVVEGMELGVPYAATYSCYNGRMYHCGLCGTCVERREAFVKAGVRDPTKYEDPIK